MGHDITGARSEKEFDDACSSRDRHDWPWMRRAEFPYMNYGMGRDRVYAVYKALGCEDLNAGASGKGSGRTFLPSALRAAEEELAATRDAEPEWIREQEQEFFAVLQEFADAQGFAYIFFA